MVVVVAVVFGLLVRGHFECTHPEYTSLLLVHSCASEFREATTFVRKPRTGSPDSLIPGYGAT